MTRALLPLCSTLRSLKMGTQGNCGDAVAAAIARLTALGSLELQLPNKGPLKSASKGFVMTLEGLKALTALQGLTRLVFNQALRRAVDERVEQFLQPRRHTTILSSVSAEEVSRT